MKMKQMRFDLKNKNPFSFSLSSSSSTTTQKGSLVVKFAVCFLLLGLAFRLFSSSSVQFSPETTTTDPSLALEEKTLPPPADPISGHFPVNETQDSQNGDSMQEIPVKTGFVNETLSPSADELPVSGDFLVNETKVSKNVTTECDIFTGHWIPDPSGPYYTNQSCRDIEAHQNCMKNGRPDSEYLYWRWKPRDCELPKFDPKRFLNLMRNKSWAFIGDSISRNHVQSFLCTLSQVEEAVEVYHDKEYKSKRWHFPSHNFTLSVIWTPFLVKAAIFEDINGVSSADIQLHLDKLDTLWTKQYKNFDYVIIAGGKWFLKTAIYYENNTIQGCHYCSGKNLTELGLDYSYRKALKFIFKFITSSKHKAHVFFRTTTPDHFENGEWFSGGYCNRTAPFQEGEVELDDIDTTMRKIELEEFEKVAGMVSAQGMSLKLLDTTHLSLLRPDGHPGVYRQFQSFAAAKNAKVQNDCLHWCLPGPIDSWNELVMKMLLSG